MFRLVRVAALAGALLPAAANAVVLDFNNWRPANPGASTTRNIPGVIIEDGFSVAVQGTCQTPSPGSTSPNCFFTEQPRLSTDPLGASIRTTFAGQTIGIEQVGGGAFTFNSIDIRSASGTNPTNVDLIFTLVNGTTQTIRQPLAGSSTNPAFSFSFNVGPVTMVQLDPVERNASFQFDNINVTPFAAAVPEPATWAMMIAGFGLAGGAMRVRRRAAVAA